VPEIETIKERVPETINVAKLLKGYKTIKIPEYQRHYTWEKTNIIQFFEDIIFDIQKFHKDFEEKSPKITVYGTIIGMVDKESNRFDIIDGQQRMATLSMFILCLLHNFWKYGQDDKVLITHIGEIQKYILKGNAINPKSRFEFNYTDNDYWDLIISKFFNIDDDCKYNLEKCLEKVKKETINTDLEKNKIEIALETLSSELKRYIKSEKENGREEKDTLNTIWTWIENDGAIVENPTTGSPESVGYGMRFTRIVEDNIHTALMRFDRENNRGIQVTIDDLAKSFLVEAVERGIITPTEKKSKKDKILKAWKTFQSLENLDKEKIIQWYLIMKTGHPKLNSRNQYLRVLKMNLQIETIKSDFSKKNPIEPWDPVKTAEEIADWVKTYRQLKNYREGSERNQTYFCLKFLESMKSPWSLIIALSIACKNKSPEGDIEIRGDYNLPIRLIANLEYAMIRTIISPGDYKGNDWEKEFLKWTAWIGRFHYKLSNEDVRKKAAKKNFTPKGPFWKLITGNIESNDEEEMEEEEEEDNDDSVPSELKEIDNYINTISNDFKYFAEVKMKTSKADFFNTKKFLNYYHSLINADKFQSSTGMGSTRKAAHYRIMSQAEYYIAKEGLITIEDLSREGSTIEHIFPTDSKLWQKDSMYSEETITELRLLPNHIGNHTLLKGTWNSSLSNRKFEEKQWNDEGDDGVPKCYSKASLSITKCLTNGDVTEWTKERIVQRGDLFLKIWLHESEAEFEDGDVGDIDMGLLVPQGNDNERDLYGLLVKEEGVDLEAKAGYWHDDRKIDEESLDKIKHLNLRKEEAINEGKTSDLDEINNELKELGVGTYWNKVSPDRLTVRINQTVNAFANTLGGRIIIG